MKKITLMMAMLLLGSLGFAQVNISNGLMHYYPFNGNANDAVGAANGMFRGGTPTLTSDRFSSANSAYSFNQGAQIHSNISVAADGDFTVNGWFNTNSSEQQLIIMGLTSTDFFGSSDYENVGLRLSDGVFYNYTAAAEYRKENMSCTDNFFAQNGTSGSIYSNAVWRMATYSKIGTTLSLYIDTVLVGTTTIQDVCGNISLSEHEMYLGSNFNGLIDDVMIFNRDLTAAERAYLYNLTSTWAITGVEATESNSLSINLVPNPTSSTTQLVLPTADIYQIMVTDLTGRQVFQKQVVNSQNLEIQIATWPAGIYMVQVRNEKGGMTVQKLVKE